MAATKTQKSNAQVRKDAASDTIKSIADSVGVSYRKARRVARNLDLGVGKGATYNTLNKNQVKKLTKALS